jgi:hypothetical protein
VEHQTFRQVSEHHCLTRLYGPAVRRKGIRDGEIGLALMYPALCGAKLLAIMDIRAHPFS